MPGQRKRGSRISTTTVTSPSTMTSPALRYQALLDEGALLPDPGQALAVAALSDLYERLVRREQHARAGLLTRIGRRLGFAAVPGVEQGLYMWGGVGRGKTFLMDLFYEALPFAGKQRMHFHRFMRDVHRALNERSGSANPLRGVADDFAERGRVLCFDEFFVSDIGDAMILGELLQELFQRGVVLVATSNVEPVNLYDNGLQRQRFLPAIDALIANVAVLNVDGGIDHRMRVLEQAQMYHYPLDEAAEQSLAASFVRLAASEPVTRHHALEIEGRDVQTLASSAGVAWFDFAALCDGPRSQNDYIELSKLFHTVLIGGVPALTSKHEDQARRFISLVDEFYDRGVKLIISAAVPIPELYQGDRLTFEFERTQSRLLEMGSREYLSREHLG